MALKKLAVFDFDYTIVDDNSDTAIVKLLDRTQIPANVTALHKPNGWTAYMQAIFQLLFQYKKSSQVIKKSIKKLPAVPGMLQLITSLKDNNYDIIIISDSNTYFIDTWLEHNGLKNKILKVFTNPAVFVNGMLKISAYHIQKSCKLSSINLCKGQILEEFIKNQTEKDIHYDRIVYFGDGCNDFCPILRLKDKDLACVREGYRCQEMINKNKQGQKLGSDGKPYEVKAEVFYWKDGFQIVDKLGLK